MLAPAASKPSDVGASGKRLGLLTVVAGFCFAADLVTWHAGIFRTSAANATLLANLVPVIVAIAAWVFFKERPTRGFVLALAAAIAGSALLSAGGLAEMGAGSGRRALGDLLSALTAFWYAGYLLAVKAVRAAWSTPRVMAATTAVGLPVTLAAALAFGEPLMPEDAIGWAWLVGLGLVCQVAGQSSIAYGLGRVSAALSAIVVLVQPVVAAAIAWVLFGEALGPLEISGAALMLAAVLVAQLRPEPARDPEPLGAEPEMPLSPTLTPGATGGEGR
jgi:drug/metabolite transporter (DMT)-like permease